MALTPLPFDVRFSFPRTGQDLWTNSAILRANSTYFTDMLDSGFAESQAEIVTYSGSATSARATVEPDWIDSDEEEPPQAPLKPQQRVHTIEITDHAFNTYHAVWIWILTKQIHFKPLNPSPALALVGTSNQFCSPPDPKRPKMTNAATSILGPPPVSPKSVFRLAHLLGLQPLTVKALGAFKSGLTVDNAARQLFSSTAVEYDEVRVAAAEFAAANWVRVEKTAGMMEMMQKVDVGEVDCGGVVMKALAKAALSRASGD